MRRKKKIVAFLVCIFVISLIGVGVWIGSRKTENFSTQYEDDEDDNYVVYDGKKYQYNERLSNFLIMGIDTRESGENEKIPTTAGQADAILLIAYDGVEETVTCITIPRDTMTAIRTFSPEGEDLGTTIDHINIQYAFGNGKEKSCELMKEAVQKLLYGVPIQGYCAVNMDGIPVAVGSVGGVELVVPDDTLSKVYPEFQKGATVVITEENAEKFVRYRDTQIRQSAIDRGNRQKVFMKAFAENAKVKAAKDEKFVVRLYEDIKPYMVTNMGNDIFAKILQAENNAEMLEIPGKAVDGENFDEYQVDEGALYKVILEVFYKEVQE